MTRVLSREDGNLKTLTSVVTRSREFRDIDLSFNVRNNGELYKKRDAEAVKQAVKNLILTRYYEKPFNPFFGTDIDKYLFELNDNITASEIRDQIEQAIKVYEPRAILREITVDPRPDSNELAIEIVFRVANSEEIVSFSTVLTRLR